MRGQNRLTRTCAIIICGAMTICGLATAFTASYVACLAWNDVTSTKGED